jgi:hypothetical protein
MAVACTRHTSVAHNREELPIRSAVERLGDVGIGIASTNHHRCIGTIHNVSNTQVVLAVYATNCRQPTVQCHRASRGRTYVLGTLGRNGRPRFSEIPSYTDTENFLDTNMAVDKPACVSQCAQVFVSGLIARVMTCASTSPPPPPPPWCTTYEDRQENCKLPCDLDHHNGSRVRVCNSCCHTRGT